MTPGDELRHAREMARLCEAQRLFRWSLHFSAGAAVLGVGSIVLAFWHADAEATWWLILASFVLSFASRRAHHRARGMLL